MYFSVFRLYCIFLNSQSGYIVQISKGNCILQELPRRFSPSLKFENHWVALRRIGQSKEEVWP